MWPSFSLCAWRILKIRSCLRRPLAPGRSSWRAILVNSVMFFSFNSEIVIVTYGDLAEGQDGILRETRRRRGALMLRAAVLRLRSPVLESRPRAPNRQCGSEPHSSCPGCEYLDGGTCASPSRRVGDRKSTRLNSSHVKISYAVFCLKKKNELLKPESPHIGKKTSKDNNI